jgi:hypothetical protein
MRSVFLALFLVAGIAISGFAQEDLFGGDKKQPAKGWVISVHALGEKPMADMAERFGSSYRFGPNVFYKTSSNWTIGVKGDFIFGNKVHEPGFLDNMNSSNTTSILNNNGARGGFGVYERGYTVGIQGGRIFNKILSKQPDNGLMIMTTVGFIQHRILLSDKNDEYPQIAPAYRKGYDRLANGLFIEQFVGYSYFDKRGFLNFNIGLNMLAGFTQGRRTYWFDVQKPGNDKRLDILTGIRLSWYIPAFKRKSEELFFE